MIQLANRISDLAHVHAVSAIIVSDKGAPVGQVIELDRHPLAVGVLQTEAQAPERRGKIRDLQLSLRGIVRGQHLCKVHLLAVIHHVLQSKQSGDVRFSLFHRTIELF